MEDTRTPTAGRHPPRVRPTAVSRSRSTSSSSVLTSASMNASPIKVAVVSSTSQPQVSQDYASAHIKHNVGEAIPELQRTLSDLDIESRESAESLSDSSRERTPRPRHTEEVNHSKPLHDVDQARLASPSKRRPLGSRRSTISASAATTSVNLETADSITATATMDAISGLLSKSINNRALPCTERTGKELNGREDTASNSDETRGSKKKRDKGNKVETNRTRSEAALDERNGKAQKEEPCLQPEKNCMSLSDDLLQAMANNVAAIVGQSGDGILSTYPQRRYYILTSAGKPVFCSCVYRDRIHRMRADIF